MNETEVNQQYKKWANTPVTEEIVNETLQFLKSQQNHLSEQWITVNSSPAYQQTFEKIDSYILVINGENFDYESIKGLTLEVDKRVLGLYKNWSEDLKDKCIAPVLQHYCYLRSILQMKMRHHPEPSA